jgi:fibronectin type 3 domain-containing protein
MHPDAMRCGPPCFRASLVATVSLLLCTVLISCHRTHSVTLNWRVSTSVNVVAYNIYRRPDYSSDFVRIASRVPRPPYEDRLVMNGRTYVYAVTAVDQGGRESSYSAEVRATID